ncbi:MAG: flagellar motor switch phosphatase FliY [Lachnospiraceae bacterium]|nr:flagellar motor switch phosphatase FliY [Lachnospiraceae bacterium]
MEGMLSQEEINALLNGGTDNADSGNAGVVEEALTEEEKDAVGEIANISMGTAATTLYSLVNQRVTITTPTVSCTDWDTVAKEYDRPCVFIQLSYTVGLDGKNILVLKEQDVKIIADLMMGGDGTNTSGELGELHLSAISEAMNQMMGSSATSLSNMLNMMIDISPPEASLVDLNDNFDEEAVAGFMSKTFVKVSFRMEIGDLVDSTIMQLYPIDFARKLYDTFISGALEVAGSAEPTPEPAPEPAPVSQEQMMQQAPAMDMGMPMQGMPMQGMPMQGMPMQGMPMGYGMPMQNVNVQPAQFQPFANNLGMLSQQENIDLIMDVPLEVTVELGRTSKSIHDILEFAPGTILELNKIAGEPIDVLVNGKYVAKGEVVVIEESFGIRITEIIH